MKCVKLLFSVFLLVFNNIHAQETFPINGVQDKRLHCYAFINAKIYQSPQKIINQGTLLIQDGKIIEVGASVHIPNNAIIVNCLGKSIYPGLIDIYADYGIESITKPSGAFNYNTPAQIESKKIGPFNWNQAIKSELNAVDNFKTDTKKAETLRSIGFSTVLTHIKDGIIRGTGTIVTLADEKENMVILKEKASMHYSFNKGTSTQSYPSSIMGSVALVRQTLYDAIWYKQNPEKEGKNMSLQAINENKNLPQIFEVTNKWSILRASRISTEFNQPFIIKAGNDGYQRIKEIANTKLNFILGLEMPTPMEIEDPIDAKYVSLADLKHWELAPTNLANFEKENIRFCLTTADLKDIKQFYKNLRIAIKMGLSESKALEALTILPAELLGVQDKIGSIEAGKWANFIITTENLFAEKNKIVENWIQGKKYEVNPEAWQDLDGNYTLQIQDENKKQKIYANILIKNNSAQFNNPDSFELKLKNNSQVLQVEIFKKSNKKPTLVYSLSGVYSNKNCTGVGIDEQGNKLYWSAQFIQKNEQKDSFENKNEKATQILSKINYPFTGYGNDDLPKSNITLFKNATVWTNESVGNLANTDVLVSNGKIVQIGNNIPSPPNAKIIDATNKHLTAGIIDEHSHIAVFSINEGGQSITSEVRIKDNLNPDDINIYRQLSGGVTASHILHGSANTIGGQTQLIKLKWGENEEGLMFKNWDPFIKFALGENVKRTTAQNNNRFPDTRMGVEQVLDDAFLRATQYEKEMQKNQTSTRRDLELDALVEILNKKRFITCHSYLQSEIVSTMRIAEKYNFKINTFTHILEGYKVADKMKKHGANVSTFSDWWAYKTEVQEAIAYNAAIMYKAGLNVCINSDDAEMARRLNQEAGKVVKYGNVSEIEAFKMVTLNPAIALHISDRVGSIKVNKDADIVLWSENPLSIYAKAEITMIEGAIYFDRNIDLEKRKEINKERNRLIHKMMEEKKKGNPTSPLQASVQNLENCNDHQ